MSIANRNENKTAIDITWCCHYVNTLHCHNSTTWPASNLMEEKDCLRVDTIREVNNSVATEKRWIER